ncbi:MAG: site-specific integrase [Alphaproteobacteria bacterium]|nr:site-specific integrase [Alphaproteobacteria bacterium]
MRIQKRTVDAISATDKRQFYWDDDLKGFGLRVEPTGLKSYVVRYRADGGGRNAPLRQVLIARHGEMTPEQARKEAERLLGSVRLGEDPGARRAEARACVTLRDLIAEFLDNHVDAKRKAATQRLYRQVLEQHVAPALGTRRAADIKRTDIARLHAKMRESPYQANRMLAIMGSLYAFSERRAFTPEGFNPARKIERYPEARRERFLRGEELERIGHAIRAAQAGDAIDPKRPGRKAGITLYAAAALRLLMFTGCRVNEILKLRWDEYDRERALLLLPDSKTGRKTIVLNSPAVTVLDALASEKDNPYVIIGAKAGTHLTDLDRPWRIVCAHAGIDGVRIHDLRHTFASVGAGASLGLPIVGKLLGHTQASTTQRYAHLDADPLRQASNLIATRIASALGD